MLQSAQLTPLNLTDTAGQKQKLLLTHTTKKHLKHSGLIIKNLVGRGDQTPDCCYNDSITIMLLVAQTGCST